MNRAEFERCWPWLAAALERGGNTHGKEDVWRQIMAETAQLWTAERGAIVTEVVQYPRVKTLRYWLVGGEMADVLRLQSRIDEWARTQGCARAEACGRLGWLRSLEGWSGRMAVLTKEL